jgi:hypothetical protein
LALNENTNHSISLEDAAKMTARYRKAAGAPLAAAFGKAAMLKILDQDDCIGFRAYYAKNEKDELTLMLAGITENGDDLYEGELAEYGAACPPFCGASNPLNS